MNTKAAHNVTTTQAGIDQLDPLAVVGASRPRSMTDRPAGLLTANERRYLNSSPTTRTAARILEVTRVEEFVGGIRGTDPVTGLALAALFAVDLLPARVRPLKGMHQIPVMSDDAKSILLTEIAESGVCRDHEFVRIIDWAMFNHVFFRSTTESPKHSKLDHVGHRTDRLVGLMVATGVAESRAAAAMKLLYSCFGQERNVYPALGWSRLSTLTTPYPNYHAATEFLGVIRECGVSMDVIEYHLSRSGIPLDGQAPWVEAIATIKSEVVLAAPKGVDPVDISVHPARRLKP